jgi:preprotein translocase subunit SecB
MPQNMSPEKFSNVLGNIEIKKVNFLDVASKYYVENLKEGEITVQANNEVELQTNEESRTLVAIDKYRLKGQVKGAPLFEIDLKLMVVFDAKVQPDKEFLTLFEQNTLKVITYPYVREAVQDLTTKMGLAPLVLPMWRVPVGSKQEYLKPATVGSNPQ